MEGGHSVHTGQRRQNVKALMMINNDGNDVLWDGEEIVPGNGAACVEEGGSTSL